MRRRVLAAAPALLLQAGLTAAQAQAPACEPPTGLSFPAVSSHRRLASNPPENRSVTMQRALSLVQNCKPGPGHGVILVLLLLASAPGPALAQTCPNPPPVTISSQLPSDVCNPTDFPPTSNPIAFFDDFSWRWFIAMVWPVQQGRRGVPDTGQSIARCPAHGVCDFEADSEVSGPAPPGKARRPLRLPGTAIRARIPAPSSVQAISASATWSWRPSQNSGTIGEAGFGKLVRPLLTQAAPVPVTSPPSTKRNAM